MAEKDIAKYIKGSKFILIKDCGHFSYIEKHDETIKVVEDFIEKVN